MSMPYFATTRPGLAPEMNSNNVKLLIRQQPHHALATPDKKEKNRKPIDPPPIVQMGVYDNTVDTSWLVSPYLFLIATLLDGDGGDTLLVGDKHILGTSSSSLHRLKDVDNKDGGFFVFGDISVRQPGRYRLRFSLFNQNKYTHDVEYLTSTDSDTFDVYNQKEFGGLRESSHLSRTFSDQGVRLRLRKEQKQIGGRKRRYASSEESPTMDNRYSGAVGGSNYGHAGPPPKRSRASSGFQSPYTMYQQGSVNAYPQLGSNMASNGYSEYPAVHGYQPGLPLVDQPAMLGGYHGVGHTSDPYANSSRQDGHGVASAPPTASYGTPIKGEPIGPDNYSNSGYMTPGARYGAQQSHSHSSLGMHGQRVLPSQQSYLPSSDGYSGHTTSSFHSDSHPQHQDTYHGSNILDPPLQRPVSAAPTGRNMITTLSNPASYPPYGHTESYGSSLQYPTPDSVTTTHGLTATSLSSSTLNSAFTSHGQYSNDYQSTPPSSHHAPDLSSQTNHDPGSAYQYPPLGVMSGP